MMSQQMNFFLLVYSPLIVNLAFVLVPSYCKSDIYSFSKIIFFASFSPQVSHIECVSKEEAEDFVEDDSTHGWWDWVTIECFLLVYGMIHFSYANSSAVNVLDWKEELCANKAISDWTRGRQARCPCGKQQTSKWPLNIL